jgi:hypothetical protein
MIPFHSTRQRNFLNFLILTTTKQDHLTRAPNSLKGGNNRI